MNKIRFTSKEKEKIQKALELFFERSNAEGDTITGLNTFDIISYLGFLVDYGYFVDCSFGVGKMAKDTWIIFIRKDIPHIKASWGVYPRICFHTEKSSNPIEVSIDISVSKHKETGQLYKFIAKPEVSNYNSHNIAKSYFDYPNYDIDAIIAKLEQGLQWFLQIPASELESY
ncbi:hypothetical protein [Helicobacter sp. T3_23-1059]